MEIYEITDNKKQYLTLLLLADEQEDMIDRYLEIKNLATEPDYQGKGYGRALIEFLAEKYTGKYSVLQVGTGESPLTVPFYEKYGFAYHHRIKNFFPDHYDHPIYECGVRLVDMVYLQRRI